MSDRPGGVRIPVPEWIGDYRREWIRPDVIAGLTAAAVVVPKAMVLYWLVGLNPGVLAMVQHSALGETLGRARMFFTLEQAVAEYQASLAPRPRSGR